MDLETPDTLAAPPPLADWRRTGRGMIAAHERFVASDVQGARRIILDFTHGHCTFTALEDGRFNGFSEARARVGEMWVRFLSWDCEMRCEAALRRGPADDVVLQIPLSGRHEFSADATAVEVTPGQLLLLTAAGEVRRRWRGAGDLLSLVLDRGFVERFLARRAGGGLPPLAGLQLAVIDLPQAPTLSRLIDTILRDLNEPAPAIRDAEVRRQFERLLVTLLFQSVAVAQGRLSDGSAPVLPGYMRRAEGFIAANLAAPLGIDALAAAAGVSARTLYYGFRRYRTTSPQLYVRSLRLAAAYAQIADVGGDVGAGTIGAIAAAVGYRNKSQFSRDYRLRFGESPRATLARARRSG